MHNFITFDIVDFYPSITPELLNRALDYAAGYINISQNDRHIIHHCKQSFLLADGDTWIKKSGVFDLAMGSYDGAECCELVGLYLLSLISKQLDGDYGLYRDDGLCVIKGTARTVENTKKQLCSLFQKHQLKITVEANAKVVNYLDITLDLSLDTYSPYMKPNNRPLYVHSHSNHPHQIIRNIPKGINKRLANIASDKRTFHRAVRPYQQALEASCHDHTLLFNKQRTDASEANKRKRRRKIIWYNPPYNKAVATNIGKRFLNLIDKEFPKGHALHKIFNRNTIKVSYSCMKNVKDIITAHNKRKLRSKDNSTASKECNCRKPDRCPLDGKCLTNNIVYQAKVTTENRSETYIGSTSCQFKTRFNNHTATFRHRDKRNSTELSNYVWSLKDKNTSFNITWRIICKAQACNNGNSACNLCTTEKLYIISQPALASLNDRRANVANCRHSNRHMLAHFNPKARS